MSNARQMGRNYTPDELRFRDRQSPAVRNTPWASRRYAVDANDRDEPWGVARSHAWRWFLGCAFIAGLAGMVLR